MLANDFESCDFVGQTIVTLTAKLTFVVAALLWPSVPAFTDVATAAVVREARLETSDIVAYEQSLNELYVGLTQQEIADLNWRLTVLAFGDKPASVTDEEYITALMTFVAERTDSWLVRLAPYDDWTFAQIMAIKQ